jgi:hypothetical protein
MNFPNIVFIAYNSTLTGSKALRTLNNSDNIQKTLYEGQMNIMKYYCKLYDNSKKNEPYFDLLASQISMINWELFDTYFDYIPVDLDSSGIHSNRFLDTQEDPLIFKMTSKIYNGYDKLTREYLDNYLNYKMANHIYIYGPITDLIYTDIIEIINKTIELNEQLFIHFQGENILDNMGNDGDTIFGMESKGNIFKNSFNYQNSMSNSNKFRNFIQTNDKCGALTIISKTDSKLCVNKINNVDLKFPLNENGEKIKNGLPYIYINFYETIGKLLDGKYYNNGTYLSLKIHSIYQDMVDKDNTSSVLFLLLNSDNLNRINIYLIGREAYNLTYNNNIINQHQSMNFSLIPDKIKPYNIDELHKNIELNMSLGTTSYWPAFKNNLYDLKYDYETTCYHYLLMTECFKICINSMLNLYECYRNDNYCIHKDLLIANPSTNSNKIALLNEILFYPSLNSYIASINNNSNYLNKYGDIIITVLNTKNYLSDIELNQIYIDYIK